jgi:hypothetical protein
MRESNLIIRRSLFVDGFGELVVSVYPRGNANSYVKDRRSNTIQVNLQNSDENSHIDFDCYVDVFDNDDKYHDAIMIAIKELKLKSRLIDGVLKMNYEQ